MGYKLSDEYQVKNVMAFLSILFGESDIWHTVIMQFEPEYLIEKSKRYMISTRPESDWGLHTNLREGTFNAYCDKWKIPRTEYNVL